MKIAIEGIQKREMEEAVKKVCPEVETIVTTDMGAVSLLKDRGADYYLGACESGGGVAISILIGLTGYRKYCTVYKSGGKPSEGEIRKYVKDGETCFGITASNTDGTVLVSMKVFPEQENH